MIRIRCIGTVRCVLILFVVLAGGIAPEASAGPWKVGAARVNITPQHMMWMAGYAARKHAAEGKFTDLWAKVLVLEDGTGRRGLLVTFDLIGIDRALSRKLCDRLLGQFGFAREQINLCFSHTHSGPVVGHNLAPLHYQQLDAPQRELIDQYAAQLPDRICEAVANALETMEPCLLAWGSGTATFAVNRRNNQAAEVPQLRAAGQLKGPHDHDVPVLAVRNVEGQLIAIVFGYACHGTVLDEYSWCGDYAGYAQLKLEQRHPDCVALYWAGCGADQNPIPRRQLKLAQQYGDDLADAVDAVLGQPLTPVNATLQVDYREVPLSLGPLPSREEIEKQAKSENKYTRARAELLLAQMADDRPLARYYPYPIGTWELGDQIQFVTLGGEVVVDFALRLKSELRGKRTWVAGYSHDVMAYIPSRRVLDEGGYEGATAMVYYGLPTAWSTAVEETIIAAVHTMLAKPEKAAVRTGINRVGRVVLPAIRAGVRRMACDGALN